MHPALSIIVFTTVSGLGYGLAIFLGLGLLDPATVPAKVGHGMAISLIALGLLSSTLHLGNPQRAWRALSQWRSSWLSREGVMALLTFVPLTCQAWLCLFDGRYSPLAGWLTVLGALGTVYCTAMIYTSLKSVDAWHSWLTPVCYLLFAMSGGLLGGALLRLASGTLPAGLAAAGLAVLVAAWGAKVAWWRRLRSLQPRSTPESATGLGFIGKVRLLEPPHVNGNYLTREMGFRIARKHSDKLTRIALGSGGGAAGLLFLLAAALGQGTLAFVLQLVAVLAFALGVVVERWLFFAQARHAVMNYYGGAVRDWNARLSP